MAKSEVNDAASLRLIISEQHRDYDYLLGIYDRTRATESILLTAAYAALAYLYYGSPGSGKQSIAERLAIPSQDYGRVIYFIALAFFAYGLLKLTLTVFGHNPWQTAYERTKTSYPESEIENLKYIKNRYEVCSDFNTEKYDDRKKMLTFNFYCILISAIILIVIKTLN